MIGCLFMPKGTEHFGTEGNAMFKSETQKKKSDTIKTMTVSFL